MGSTLGVKSIFDAFGNLLAVVSAFSQAFDMYNKTNCAWKAGAAASIDFLVSVLAGMLVGFAWLIVTSTGLALIFAAAIVALVGYLAGLVLNILLNSIRAIPYCLNLLQRLLYAKLSPLNAAYV